MLRASFSKTFLLSTFLLVSCGPPVPVQNTPPSSSIVPTATPIPNPVPVQTPFPAPTVFPFDSPANQPVGDNTKSGSLPTLFPSEQQPSSSPLPLTTATSSMAGHVFDEEQAPLDGVTITVRSLDTAKPFAAEKLTAKGLYLFERVPLGLRLEITASKKGFTTRKRVEVLSRANDKPFFNFGNGSDAESAGPAYLALSDRPEVMSVIPVRLSRDIEPGAAIVLQFSEAMDTKTVENNFAIRAFKNRRLTVDKGSSVDTFLGAGDVANLDGTRIWDKEAFNITWNETKTTATFTFKNGRALPSDKELELTPEYQILFQNDRLIKDVAGVSRNHHHFAVVNAPAEESVPFRIIQDTLSPSVTRIQASSAEGGITTGDTIKVFFSEPMRLYTLGKTLGGGMENTNEAIGKAPAGFDNSSIVTSQAVAENYTVKVTRNQQELFSGSWGMLGGQATMDSSDPSAATVILTLPAQPLLTTTVAGAPPNQAALSGSALLTNGESAPLDTLPLPIQTNLTNGHVAAGANLTAALIETADVVYTDGLIEELVDLPDLTNNVYTGGGSLQAKLTALFSSGNSVVKELQSTGSTGNNVVETGDQVNVTLQNNPTRSYLGKARPIAWIKLKGGIFESSQLNMANYIIVSSQPKVLQAGLNHALDEDSALFSVSEGGNPDGIWQTVDTLTLSLSSDPKIGGTTIRFITLNPTGALAANALNIPGWRIFPGLQAGERPNIFQSGDEIWLEALYTIMDPAGNGIDVANATTPAG